MPQNNYTADIKNHKNTTLATAPIVSVQLKEYLHLFYGFSFIVLLLR